MDKLVATGPTAWIVRLVSAAFIVSGSACAQQHAVELTTCELLSPTEIEAAAGTAAAQRDEDDSGALCSWTLGDTPRPFDDHVILVVLRDEGIPPKPADAIEVRDLGTTAWWRPGDQFVAGSDDFVVGLRWGFAPFDLDFDRERRASVQLMRIVLGRL